MSEWEYFDAGAVVGGVEIEECTKKTRNKESTRYIACCVRCGYRIYLSHRDLLRRVDEKTSSQSRCKRCTKIEDDRLELFLEKGPDEIARSLGWPDAISIPGGVREDRAHRHAGREGRRRMCNTSYGNHSHE